MWKQIEKLNYEVSKEGVVRNIITQKIIKGSKSSSGYKMVSLHTQNGRVTKQVHRLVAINFIDNPENKPQVNHIDGNKLNNNVNNLEWVTGKENMKHALDTGIYKRYNNQTYKNKFGAEHNRSVKLSCGENIYYGYSEASRKTGIKISTIHWGVKHNKPVKGVYFQKI